MQILLKKVSKKYANNKQVLTSAVSDVNFSVREGEFVAITGPSGSGKTTLLYLIGMLLKPDSGEYFFNGENVLYFPDALSAKTRNKKIGFIFQSFCLTRGKVIDNVSLPLRYSGSLSNSEIRRKAQAAISTVGLENYSLRNVNTLSGGEQQRVAIARAIANDPDIICADEPTGNLDSASGNDITDILQKLNSEGKTVLLVTHNNAIAEKARRRVEIRDGFLKEAQSHE